MELGLGEASAAWVSRLGEWGQLDDPGPGGGGSGQGTIALCVQVRQHALSLWRSLLSSGHGGEGGKERKEHRREQQQEMERAERCLQCQVHQALA